MDETERLQKEQVEKLAELRRAYISTFSTDDGKKVLEDLEKHCYENASTFDGDANWCVYREGVRSALLHIRTRMTFDPEKIKKAIDEKGGENL